MVPALAWLLSGSPGEASAQQRVQAGDSSESRTPVPGPISPLDAPISRTAYRLGPGDVVTVSVFGDLNRIYTVTVTPEGTVVIPSVGVARVLDLNLDQAQDRIRDLVFRYYRNVDVNLTLSQVRAIKVFVLGAVPEPGVHVASSATRVSEVVPGFTADSVVHRNILLRRASGDTLSIDLLRFRQTGDLSANPTLREGDALVVPAVDERVQVFGRVAFPGMYEYRRGESLAQLLLIANGPAGFRSDAADTIRLSRFVSPREREFYQFTRAEALGERGQRFSLQPFDAVYVPGLSDFKQQKTATIRGQVVRPGTYPIVPGETTARDLVALAGGFTLDASLVNAVLRREPDSDRIGSPGELNSIPAELLSDEEKQILEIRSRGDASNVVTDFQKLFAEGQDAYDQPLQSGDQLIVPRTRNEVVVLGAVAQPGIVQHVPGRGLDYFVALAGGYSRRAERGQIVVLKGRSGARRDIRDVSIIEPGDQIIVPFKERVRFIDRVATVNTYVSTISTLILGVLTLNRIFDNNDTTDTSGTNP